MGAQAGKPWGGEDKEVPPLDRRQTSPARGGGSYSGSWGYLSAHPCTPPPGPCRPPLPYSLAAVSIGKAVAVAEPSERSRGAQPDSLC